MERNIRPRVAMVLKNRQREARCFVLAGAAFDIQIHRSRWVDSPESAGLIGKTSIVGTAIVADISEG